MGAFSPWLPSQAVRGNNNPFLYMEQVISCSDWNAGRSGGCWAENICGKCGENTDQIYQEKSLLMSLTP